jgi:FGGY-family pentulose kinase
MATRLVLGVDVGTGSARAGLFDLEGRMVGHASSPIETARPAADFVEQSSEDIWRASGRAIREALAAAGSGPERVAGLSFDATCSLVALDAADRPVTVSPTGGDSWNVVVWMDHRAVDETERINATGHEVLRYVGGRLSPEMEPPKLLWIKERLPESWRRTARFLDLADFLTYRSTGSDLRSMCTTVCKWTYLGHQGRWARDFFEEIGLGDLFEGGPGGKGRAGSGVEPMGTPLGGLTPSAARELGLEPGTAVGVGIIDAHAGGVGLLGSQRSALSDPGAGGLERVLCLIGGTSSCHMAVSREPRFIPGIWGPYFSAMVPGMWLTEGGQSASGSLIDHLIADAANAPEAQRLARERGETVYQVLNREVAALEAAGGGEVTSDLHVLPYFHGNRSPRADPTLRGAVSGLSLDAGLPSLARRYLAALQAIGYGTRHIIEAMNGSGYRIDTILACGGGTKNPLWLREHADATGCRIVLSREPEPVLLGAAILGAAAARAHPSVAAAMAAMGAVERTIEPDSRRREFHQRKYQVFHRMHDQLLELRALMRG